MAQYRRAVRKCKRDAGLALSTIAVASPAAAVRCARVRGGLRGFYVFVACIALGVMALPA